MDIEEILNGEFNSRLFQYFVKIYLFGSQNKYPFKGLNTNLFKIIDSIKCKGWDLFSRIDKRMILNGKKFDIHMHLWEIMCGG